ncbi:hypothetical protein [Halalkalicoccus jeotgali]|nr:hypothetical protein [Halalkalicoccus jeotgali]
MSSDTPLSGQQRCLHGHLCSGQDNFCSVCGDDLRGGEDDV